MSRIILLAAVLLTAPSVTATAMTDAECARAWESADVNKDGNLTEAEAARYHAALRVADKPAVGGTLTQANFLTHCKAGLFTASQVATGAPLEGANSFTEGQAKDRVLAQGMTNVSAMTKDDKGVWRGTAQQGDKPVKVGVDFKGNVVAQ